MNWHKGLKRVLADDRCTSKRVSARTDLHSVSIDSTAASDRVLLHHMEIEVQGAARSAELRIARADEEQSILAPGFNVVCGGRPPPLTSTTGCFCLFFDVPLPLWLLSHPAHPPHTCLRFTVASSDNADEGRPPTGLRVTYTKTTLPPVVRWNPFCQGVPLGKSLRLFVGCNRNLHPDGIVVRPPDNPMVVCDACECPLQAQAFYQCTRDHTHGDSYDLCESCHASSSHRRHGNHDDPRYDGEPGEFRTFAFADEIEDWWNGESEESEEEEEDSESEEEEEEEGEEKEEGGRGGGGDREEKKEEEPDPAQQAAEDVDRALEQMVTSLGSLLADEEGSDSDSDSDSSGPGSEEARRAFAMIMASLGGTSDSTEESSPSSSS